MSESINANIWPPLSPTKIVPFSPSAICLGASKFSAKIEILKPSSNSRLVRSNAVRLIGRMYIERNTKINKFLIVTCKNKSQLK